MKIILVGINHDNAPVELRERLAFHPAHLPGALAKLTQPNGNVDSDIVEAVILSTCNRVEVYAAVKDPKAGMKRIEEFLASSHNLPVSEFKNFLSTSVDLGVVEHLFSVASGIKSMVLGESQIQRQVKEAFDVAKKLQTVGPLLSSLFRNALTVGKRVRSETGIAKHSLSVSHVAVKLVRNTFPDLSTPNILVLGLGKMSLMAVKSMLKYGARDLTIINRSQEKAAEITKQLKIRTFGFDQLGESLKQADVVLSSTGSPHFILTQQIVEQAMQERKNKPLLIIDIAVPRDVDPEVRKLNLVNLYNIDQLSTKVENNLEQRCNEINKVRDIINQEVTNFLAWCQSLEVKPVITDLRQYAEEIREQELKRARRRFGIDLSEQDSQVVQELANRIINKMLHQPIVHLRKEAVGGNGQICTATVRKLFGLEKPTNK